MEVAKRTMNGLLLFVLIAIGATFAVILAIIIGLYVILSSRSEREL